MNASNEILQKENAVMFIITYATNLHRPCGDPVTVDLIFIT
jgi:hypothetical protein